MYKSIIFDIGGVLVDFDPKAYLVDRLCNAEMEEKVYDLTFGSEEWQLLDAGKLSRYDGNQRMLEHARAEGCAYDAECEGRVAFAVARVLLLAFLIDLLLHNLLVSVLHVHNHLF